jgi:hypothetical protein
MNIMTLEQLLISIFIIIIYDLIQDKLLVFDREHAKRTHVHDAQVRTVNMHMRLVLF